MTKLENFILYAVNHGELYERSASPIITNLTKHYRNETYNKEKAIKLWSHHVNRAAKRFVAEFGGAEHWHQMFPAKLRRKAAEALEEYYMDEISYDERMASAV